MSAEWLILWRVFLVFFCVSVPIFFIGHFIQERIEKARRNRLLLYLQECSYKKMVGGLKKAGVIVKETPGENCHLRISRKFSLRPMALTAGSWLHHQTEREEDGAYYLIATMLIDLYSRRQVDQFVLIAGCRHYEVEKKLEKAVNEAIHAQVEDRESLAKYRANNQEEKRNRRIIQAGLAACGAPKEK